MNDWISVHRALPEPGEWVLIRHATILGEPALKFWPAKRVTYRTGDGWDWLIAGGGGYLMSSEVDFWRRIDPPAADVNEAKPAEKDDADV